MTESRAAYEHIGKMATLTRLKMCVKLQVCRPQGSAPLPPPRQYAGR